MNYFEIIIRNQERIEDMEKISRQKWYDLKVAQYKKRIYLMRNYFENKIITLPADGEFDVYRREIDEKYNGAMISSFELRGSPNDGAYIRLTLHHLDMLHSPSLSRFCYKIKHIINTYYNISEYDIDFVYRESKKFFPKEYTRI